ncbi:hypothetical protein HPB48_003470 [Haemaphysalis longicornis]|uniref:Pre-PUA domain-containing protein n=1 Tax=Haemaphysalis longicornis TaxID=44386 RepID=A0A9J6G548_HAELO|nr:hypothetical protein HPB48_003470 [Haemaphysalis longicornis]
MFKKFDEKEHVSGITQLKSSVQKAIKGKILEQFPQSEDYINQILPKKDLLRIVKCHDHVEILVNGAGELLFFRQREGPYLPTLRLLHRYPFLCPWQQVDKGAIRFVLSGANIMCPGLTSPGARMTPVPKGAVVVSSAAGLFFGGVLLACKWGRVVAKSTANTAIMAEGKEHPLAVGFTGHVYRRHVSEPRHRAYVHTGCNGKKGWWGGEAKRQRAGRVTRNAGYAALQLQWQRRW